MVAKDTKTYSCATMPLASAFRPTCNICSALATLSRKNSLNQHFFIQKSKIYHETAEYSSQWWQNTKNYSLETMLQASAFTHTYNISSALAPLPRKNSLSQHFSIQKSKLVMKPLNLRANGGKTPITTPGQQCHSQMPSGPHAKFLQP